MYPSGLKTTWLAQAQAIANGVTPTAAEDVPRLLGWLRDCNWPGARIIAQFLPRFGDRLVSPVREILRSQDTVWIYWLCTCLLDKCSRVVCSALDEDLKRLAYAHDQEGAHVAALLLVARHRLDAPERIREAVAQKRATDADNEAEYQEILTLLD